MDYMLKRIGAFTRFLADGRICLSNNAAERMRAFVEKDTAFRGTAVVNSGVYLLSLALLDAIVAMPGPSLKRTDRETPRASRRGGARTHRGFVDIGTPETLATAATLLAPMFGPVAAAETEG